MLCTTYRPSSNLSKINKLKLNSIFRRLIFKIKHEINISILFNLYTQFQIFASFYTVMCKDDNKNNLGCLLTIK